MSNFCRLSPPKRNLGRGEPLVESEDDFAGFAAFHGLDGGFIFGEGHLVGDDGGDVEIFLVEEPDHLVPGVPETAADDAVD